MHFFSNPLVVVAALQAGMIIVPGSDYALMMRTVGEQGENAGVATAIGLGLGALALLLIAIFGINALFVLYPGIMTIVRYAGAAWLLWQAVLCFAPRKKHPKPPGLGSFTMGFVNHFINIEMIVFYIAIMSQLTARGISTQLQLIAAAEMALFTAVWFVAVARLAGSIPKGEKILNHRVTRIVFGLLFLVSAVILIRTSYT